MFRHQLVLFVLLVSVVLSGCGETTHPAPSTTIVTPSQSSVSTLTPTTILDLSPTATTPSGSAGMIAINYYHALEDHKYTTAYTYLDANATDTTTGHELTLQLFMQLAQSSDNAGGPITSFSAAAYPPLVVMTVSRGGGRYHVHLMVKQEASTWKITSLDRI